MTDGSIIRFAEDVAPAERAVLLTDLATAGLAASTGLDLGDRGPSTDGNRPLAAVAYLAGLAAAPLETGAVVCGTLAGWLRKVAAPGEPAYAELDDKQTGNVLRISGTDGELAWRALDSAWKWTGELPLRWNGVQWAHDDDEIPSPRPTAFVSYAHESEAHKADVLRLCDLLAACGVEPWLDRFALDVRRDWQLWATNSIREADHVLVIASPTCQVIGDGGRTSPEANRGLKAEMRILRELYQADNERWTKKILPVILPGRTVAEIPLFLQPHSADHFRVTAFTEEGAAGLLDVLLGRPPFPGPGTPDGRHG